MAYTVKANDLNGLAEIRLHGRDVAGNMASEMQIDLFAYIDTEPPMLTLNGATSASVVVGGDYTDAGVTKGDSTDTLDTVISDSNGELVDAPLSITTAGVYTYTYTATDKAGNTTTLTRTVTVNTPLSADATLSSLTITDSNSNAVDLEQTFDATTEEYTARVANDVEEVTVTPTVNHVAATVSVNNNATSTPITW